MAKKKLIRLTTISLSQNLLLKGQLRYLNRYFEVVAVASGEEELAEVGKREGVRTRAVEMKRTPDALGDLVALFRLYRLFREERPDIVHANTPKASLLGLLAARMVGVKHRVYTVTGLRFETERGAHRQLLRLVERVTCALATKVIPEGEGVKNLLRKERITAKPLEIIHHGNINGVDMEWYDDTPEVKMKSEQIRDSLSTTNRFTFCFVGRMVEEKGIRELVEAFSQLNARKPDTTLLLVGPYDQDLHPLREEVKRQISNNPAIHFVGYQHDIRPYLAASDVLAFPSYREGFPNVVLQAGAMGLPAIVTDISGCNEIISDGVNGIIIPPRDAAALGRAMERLMASKEEKERMSAVARTLIGRRFRQNDVWEKLKEMYLSLDQGMRSRN